MAVNLSDAVRLLQGGHVDDAKRELTRLASGSSLNADVYRWLAIAHARKREFVDGRRAIQRAIELNPVVPDYYLTAANISQDLGELDSAANSLTQAIRIDPNYAEGHNNLGIVLTDLGRIVEAIPAFQEAIRLKPRYARAHANLAAAQLRSLQFSDALESAGRAAAIQPDYAHAHHLCGNALVLTGKSEAALAKFEMALRLKPDFVEASLLFAKTLMKLKRVDEAAKVLQSAIALSPGRAELWSTFGDIPAERDEMAVAFSAYERAFTLRPEDIGAIARAALLLPNIYENAADVLTWRARITSGIAQLCENAKTYASALPPEKFGESIPNSFFLAYQGGDDKLLQRDYADFVRELVRKSMPAELNELARTNVAGRRIRIGFCCRFFFRSTAGNYFASWITDLDRDIFEIFLYHTHVADDDLTKRLREASDHFFQAEESFAFFQRKIRADSLDILIFPEIGMDRIVYLLAALRFAPIQISAWGHPVTPGHRSIDYFISSEMMEPPDAEAHYNERLLLLPGIGTRYKLPKVSPEVAAKTRSDYQLPEHARLYLFPQSLFKIHPDNDQLLVNVLANDPNGILVMFAGQNENITRRFISRLSAAFDARHLPANGRVKLLPGVGHDDYKRINQLCDLMLDTLHWSGGHTSLDALAMGLPIVTMPGKFMRGRQTMGMLKLLDAEELIVSTIADYLATAFKLANDRAYRDQISQRILANRGRLFDDLEPTRELGRILATLVRSVDTSADTTQDLK